MQKGSSMPQLILIRHGNTFETGETATWVGARTDMKLTAKGEEQGQAAAAMVAARFLPLGGLIAGPLQRTRRFAELIAAKTNAVYTVDERLIEIDYGTWENISSDEIRARMATPTGRLGKRRRVARKRELFAIP
jgi:probable phosphoglycerate mutase